MILPPLKPILPVPQNVRREWDALRRIGAAVSPGEEAAHAARVVEFLEDGMRTTGWIEHFVGAARRALIADQSEADVMFRSRRSVSYAKHCLESEGRYFEALRAKKLLTELLTSLKTSTAGIAGKESK